MLHTARKILYLLTYLYDNIFLITLTITHTRPLKYKDRSKDWQDSIHLYDCKDRCKDWKDSIHLNDNDTTNNIFTELTQPFG